MNFYTSVSRYGNKILYRGYNENGSAISHKYDFKPKLFVSSKEDEGWRSLDGENIAPVEFANMREARDFLDRYGQVDNFKVYGTDRYIHQFIAEKFPNEIKFNRNLINVCNIDIEVASDDGFPLPEEALYPVISIALKSSKSTIYEVWGLGDYDASQSELDIGDSLIHYRKFDSEVALLASFVSYWVANCPDVITGWNVRFFDVPYLVNRIQRVGSDIGAKRLSPWNMVDERNITTARGTQQSYSIAGVEQLDYLELFKKFGYTYGAQESYKLDHIAHVVLGEKKLSYEEYGSLHSLYKSNHQKFIDYNIKDVQLVDRLEDKMGLITLALTVAYKGGVNYGDTFGVTAIWDSIIYRELVSKKIVPAINKNHMSRSTFAGGYVKDPHVGMHEWVVSFDLNSLYPNIIAQWNMSPETLVPTTNEIGVDYYLEEKNLPVATKQAVAANGSQYKKNKTGIIPRIIVDFYEERTKIKKKMLKAKQKYEKEKSYESEKEISRLDNQQMAIKILLNSLYGALGNQHFRYFDLRLAEGVTLTGQLVIRWAEKAMNKAINEILKTNEDYVIAIDTDSVYVNFGPIIKKFNPKNPVEFIDKICADHFEKILEKSFKQLHDKMNCYNSRMVMAREVIADRGIWTAKKRYILNVHNNEGVQYAEPKLKIMGIEAIKSSTPEIVRDKLKEVFKIIMNGSESETQEFIQKFKSEFSSLAPEDVAFPRGVSSVTDWRDKKSVYKKGTPIHVRGSLLYNKQITDLKLEKKYEMIQNGEKIKFCYLKLPNPIRENVISFPSYLPPELKLHNYINYNLQFEKTFIEPLTFILNAIDWTAEPKLDLEDIFG